MDAILRDLTAPQREAVCHVDGPMLILAGPGSGKTRTITHRIAYLLSQGIPSWQIAGVTFTNKAAGEMRERVERLAPGESVWLGTFHRFCARQLRRYAAVVGLSENFSIYDVDDSRVALKEAIRRANVSLDFITPDQVGSGISRLKNRLITPDDLEQATADCYGVDGVLARVYPLYRQLLLEANAVDFDDLLLHFARLLRENPEIRQELDARFRYIMVDEYQDTNLAQYAIVRAMSIDHPNLVVTGDPDQSIYGWRGADLNNILDFEKDYGAVRTVRLEQNYRSTPNILRAADSLIRHNRRRKAKDLFTVRPEGAAVAVRVFDNGQEEASEIASLIAEEVAGGGRRPREFAILCRMNYLTRSLENALRRVQVPYRIINGQEFYKRKEIKDLLAYLHLINNSRHNAAFERIINLPPRGIGAVTLRRLKEHAERRGVSLLEAARDASSALQMGPRSVSAVERFVRLYDRLAYKATGTIEDLLRTVVEETALEDYLAKIAEGGDDVERVQNVSELINDAVEFDRKYPEDGSLDLFLEEIALMSDTDAFENEQDTVSLMTLHSAKGLEFPRVFIMAVEDGILPHYRSSESMDELEEERRLLFVGITRAMDQLDLSYCKSRLSRGAEHPVVPSQFLNQLPRSEIEYFDFTSAGPRYDDEVTDPVDAGGYPSDWDAFDDEPGGDDDQPIHDVVSEAVGFIADTPPGLSDDESVRPKPRHKQAKTSRKQAKASLSGVTTAAQLLASGSVPLAAYREGCVVRHTRYGQGEIVEVTGRGPKRTARIRFADETLQFRLAFAELELVESSDGPA